MTGLGIRSAIGSQSAAESVAFGAGTATTRGMPGLGTAPRFGLKTFAVPILVLALRFIPGGVGHVAYLVLFVYAFVGRRQAILSLYLLCLCNNATHAFGAPPGLAAIYRFVVIFAAAISVMALHAGAPPRSSVGGPVMATLVLCGLLLAHSLVASQVPDVSTLKALVFTVTILTLLIGWSRLDLRDRALLERQIWGTLIGLTVLGFPLAFTGYGYVRTKVGFQGLLEHSQTYGPFMGVLAVYLLMTWMTMQRASKLTIGMILLALASIYLSRARIGALVLVAGLAAGILTGLAIRLRDAPRLLKRRLAIIGSAFVVALVFAGPWIITAAQEFIAKDDLDPGGENLSITEAAMQSRGFIIELMMRNIEQYPLTGIGFGVATLGGMAGEIQRDPIFGLPIMAAVEKGVLPVAIVEELGIPLALLFAAWFLMLFVMAARGGPVNVALLTAALATNIAECCFFSPGGMGMFFLVIATMAVTAGPSVARDRRLAWRQAAPPLGLAA